MPYKDAEQRKRYGQSYRQTHSRATGGAPGRPPADDAKVLWSIRLKGSIVGRLDRLLLEGLATGKFPWKNRSQQAADLLIRGMETLKDHESVDEALQYLRAVRHSESIRQHRREAQSAWAIVDEELRELKAIRATDQAVHQFWANYAAFEAMSPSTWRDWLLKMMRETHKDLYEKQPGEVELTDRDSEDPHARPKRARVVKMKRAR